MADGTQQQLDGFLAGVERKAFRMAHLATGNADQALDIVQDAMLLLVQNYRDKPAGQWKALFYRILQNRIRDWHRRQWVRRRVMSWFFTGPQDEEPEPLQLPDPDPSAEDRAVARQDLAVVEEGLKALPLRQQQAFLLRAWEELSVAETAKAMGCSEGSVKTHYFRAVNALRRRLEEQDER